MSIPEIPSTFPFRKSYSVGESFSCFYDLRAQKGRVNVLHNFENPDSKSKIPSFSMMIVEFSHPNSAIAFMEDEAARFDKLGTELKSSKRFGDQYLAAFDQAPYFKTCGEVLYSIRVGVLVFRIAFALMELTESDDPSVLTQQFVASILDIYKNVDVKY